MAEKKYTSYSIVKTETAGFNLWIVTAGKRFGLGFIESSIEFWEFINVKHVSENISSVISNVI